MTENAVVRARIDPHIKLEAAAVLQSMGLTLSDAFRLLMMRVVAEKSLPFDIFIPNDAAIQAIKAARQKQVKTVKSKQELFANLNADN